MGKSQSMRSLANASGRILEYVPVGNRDEKRFVKTLGTPAHSSAQKIGQVTDSQRLRMTAITPIRIQVANRSMLLTNLRRKVQIWEAIVMASNQGHPRGRSGADIKRHF